MALFWTVDGDAMAISKRGRCGFCVAYFAKAKERFYHIASQQYERGEDISK